MRVFNPLHHSICFAPVHRLSPSTWTGHIPFAMFLTSILKPRKLVELGTFYGTSYCAFCQTVQELKLETHCYAVDTWEGDPQSGFYGAEILSDLRNYHDHLYSDFSRLIQSTFDAALSHFTDKTIDLLHIDGFHTYEAVKKDFEVWLPKMSERGVILFHDINVREKDFGVWKFWEEIRTEYPHFEFTHSHGLGVLAVGENCPPAFNEFLEYSLNNRVQITNFFYQQGQRLENLQELQILRKTIPQQQDSISELQESNKSLFEEKNLIAEQLSEMEKQIVGLEQKIHEKEAQAANSIELQQELELEDVVAVAKLKQELEEKEKQLAEESRILQNKFDELDKTEQFLNDLGKKLMSRGQDIYGKEWELQTALAKIKHSSVSNGNGVNGRKELNSNGKDKSAKTLFKLVIGVVTYNNSEDQINHLLTSIELANKKLKGLPVKIDICVLDNGQESHWRASSLPIIRFKSEGNVGFGKAMNRLMKIAFADPDAKWFLCLNPDGTLHRDALKELLLMSGEHPKSLIEARQFPEEHNKEYNAETFETPWASGACLLISNDIFKVIGGFDPNFFMYLEDVDLSWRVRSAGFSVKIAPRAIFGHSVLDRDFNETTDKYMLLSGRYLAAKWQNQKFLRWAENELVTRNYYSSLSELPELPAVSENQEYINRQYSNFAHYFSFSTTRW